MGAALDLTGQRFGRLVALEPTEKRSGSHIVWRCQCDCGAETLVSTDNLRSGCTRSCGCLQRERTAEASALDLRGQRFGRLVALEPTEERRDNRVIWRCRCDCGAVTLVSSHNLHGGLTRSCGCSRILDLQGQRFGRLVALEPTKERVGSSVGWRCQCDCGIVTLVSSHALRRGHTRSCGCLGTEVLRGQTGERNSNWRGGRERYYGPDWHSQRRRARERDNYTCQECGITEDKLDRELDVHHKIRLAAFENPKDANMLSNLVSLCPDCHRKREREGYEEMPLFSK